MSVTYLTFSKESKNHILLMSLTEEEMQDILTDTQKSKTITSRKLYSELKKIKED